MPPWPSNWVSDLDLERFYWLGSGPRQGLACELSLKMKEMSLTHSEPFHFMEFRHGPKAMVTPQALVIGLRSTRNGSYETAVLEDVKSLRGRVLDMAEDPDLTFDLPRDLRKLSGMCFIFRSAS